MNIDNLKNMINESRRKQDSKSVSLLSFLLGEYESQINRGNKVTVEQVIRHTISDNNICLESRNDTNLIEENEFLKTLLPSYLTVAQLRDILTPLQLGNDGKSIGIANKHMKATGLNYLPETIKEALS